MDAVERFIEHNGNTVGIVEYAQGVV